MMPWSPVVFERKRGICAQRKLIVALACATSHTSPPRSVQTAAVSAPVDMMMTRRHTVLTLAGPKSAELQNTSCSYEYVITRGESPIVQLRNPLEHSSDFVHDRLCVQLT